MYINIPKKSRSEKEIYWEIYDISGKIIKKGVQSGSFERLNITDISSFKDGVFFVIVKSKRRLVGVGKFIK